MNYIQKLTNKKKFSKITIAKITLIVFSSIYLIGNFEPYYDGIDSFLYGITAKALSAGSYEISNDLLDKSGKWEFIPHQWIQTVHNTAIPKANPGFPLLATVSYILAKDFGLFYLGPFFTIALLIVSERIATKLFNDKVGFVALLLLATNFMVFTVGTSLITDSAFSFFGILGSYYFLKFLKNNSNTAIILSSLFFVTATLIRIAGIVFFPLEILLFVSYLVFYSRHFKYKDQISNNKFHKNFLSLVSKKKVKLFFLLLIIPWICFFFFLVSYNSYYFGDPFTGYSNILPIPTILSEFTGNVTLISDQSITIDQSSQITNADGVQFTSQRILLIEDRLEVARNYFLYLLPSQFPWSQTLLETYENYFGNNFLGVIPILFLPLILILSFKIKSSRTEISVFTLTILSIIGIYSIISIPDFVVGRYVLLSITIFSILLAYLIVKIFELIPRIWNSKPIFYKSIKGSFLVFLIVYFSFSFFISDPIQWLVSENFEFKNPEEYARNYPLENEDMAKNSILVNFYGTRALEYGLIPFNGHIGNYIYHYSSDGFSKGSVELLKLAMSLDHDAYVLKKSKNFQDKDYSIFLLNGSLVLKDYSKTFCKIVVADNSTGRLIPEPDQICYEEVELPSEKRWYDFLIK